MRSGPNRHLPQHKSPSSAPGTTLRRGSATAGSRPSSPAYGTARRAGRSTRMSLIASTLSIRCGPAMHRPCPTSGRAAGRARALGPVLVRSRRGPGPGDQPGAAAGSIFPTPHEPSWRFDVGERVACKMGEDTWLPGTVEAPRRAGPQAAPGLRAAALRGSHRRRLPHGVGGAGQRRSSWRSGTCPLLRRANKLDVSCFTGGGCRSPAGQLKKAPTTTSMSSLGSLCRGPRAARGPALWWRLARRRGSRPPRGISSMARSRARIRLAHRPPTWGQHDLGGCGCYAAMPLKYQAKKLRVSAPPESDHLQTLLPVARQPLAVAAGVAREWRRVIRVVAELSLLVVRPGVENSGAQQRV